MHISIISNGIYLLKLFRKYPFCNMRFQSVFHSNSTTKNLKENSMKTKSGKILTKMVQNLSFCVGGLDTLQYIWSNISILYILSDRRAGHLTIYIWFNISILYIISDRRAGHLTIYIYGPT